MKLARHTFLLRLGCRLGLPRHRALQEDSWAEGTVGAPRLDPCTQAPPACSRPPAPHSSPLALTGPTLAAPVGKRSWKGGGTDLVAPGGRLQKVRPVPRFTRAPQLQVLLAPGQVLWGHSPSRLSGMCVLGFLFLPLKARGPNSGKGPGHSGCQGSWAAGPHVASWVRTARVRCTQPRVVGGGAEGREAGRVHAVCGACGWTATRSLAGGAPPCVLNRVRAPAVQCV